MPTDRYLLLIVLILCGSLVNVFGQKVENSPALTRSVAITLDDLPVAGGADIALTKAQQITIALIDHLRTFEAPAVVFVNEAGLAVPGEEAERVALLERWIDAGFELGNHTYSHASFYTTPLPEFEEEVVRGQEVSDSLLSERGSRVRFFRHPYLQTGPDEETKQRFAGFLTKQELEIAPVTIGHYDWLYAAAYDEAEGDSLLRDRVKKAYFEYIEMDVEYSEQLSRELFDYEVPQILLLHSNALNADHLDRVLELLEQRGYRFISLDEALRDQAYSLGDTYTGPRALNWLERWWFSKHGEIPGIPPAHCFARELTGITLGQDLEREPCSE